MEIDNAKVKIYKYRTEDITINLPDYEGSIGDVNYIFADEDGNVVGMQDEYDFDLKWRNDPDTGRVGNQK